jgi:hypothetical protein
MRRKRIGKEIVTPDTWTCRPDRDAGAGTLVRVIDEVRPAGIGGCGMTAEKK